MQAPAREKGLVTCHCRVPAEGPYRLIMPNHEHTASGAEWHDVTLSIAHSRSRTLLQQEVELPKHNLALTRSPKRVAIIFEVRGGRWAGAPTS
jgi:hypothetical protein